MILAWLKLRRRNIAPLLDASGWAVNGRALVNVPFGATLTTLATLPVGASLGGDKYAVKGSSSGRLAVLIFIVWWGYAFLSDQGYLQALLAR